MAVGSKLALISQASLKEIKRFQKDILTTNKRLEMLTQHVMHIELIIDKFIMKVDDNANSIRLLEFILSRISANMVGHLSKY